MANTIILKKSSTAAKVPLAGDLQVGELAVNLADQKLYSKNAGGTVVLVGSGASASGDVVGPSSATDNAVARFDTTTGKLIQNSVLTVDDSGNAAGILSEQYNTVTTPPTIVEGLEAWDSGNGTLEVGLKGGNVSYKYGQQEFVRAYNGSGSTMTKGQVVYIVGAQGNRVDVRLAKADAESTSAGTIGFVAESIANGAEGWVQASGTIPKLDTSTFTAGDPVYLSAATAGAITTTRPTAPNHTVILGWIERVSATVGSIYIKVDNGYELQELHNVLITSPASGNTLIYDAAQGVWENANITAGTGISVTNGAGSITVANTGVTSVSTGTGLSGGPITTTGTISLANTAVSAGSYTYASITVDAQGRLTSASSGASPSAFPAGTAMMFVQTAAPTGWTKSTTHNNKALRVVSGTASSGGTVAFTTAFASKTPAGSVSTSTTVSLSTGGSVSAYTLSISEMPSHQHSNAYNSYGGVSGPGFYNPAYYPIAGNVNPTGGSGSHAHGFTNPTYSGSSSSSFTGTAIDLAVQYVDVIIATKD